MSAVPRRLDPLRSVWRSARSRFPVGPAAEPPAPAPGPVRCRQIAPADLDAVVALLCEGFADRTPAYWRRGLDRHLARRPPEGFPLYGFMLEHAGRAVGVLLTLHTAVSRPAGPAVVCNLSSWYVQPAFRPQASLLDRVATRRPGVTYLNVTPAPQTWASQEARGFVRYCDGQMFVLPALSRAAAGLTVREPAPDDPLADLAAADRTLVQDHRRYGCLVLLGTDGAGTQPFVFLRRTIGLIPNNTAVGRVGTVQLVYGRSLAEFARFAGPIGRHLLRRHRLPWLVVDANAPVPGVVGRFFAGRAPKYRRGPDVVGLGDLSYTELVLFGP